MPKLGETVVEGIIVRWLKRPGDIVRADEPLAEVESDKVSTDLPSPVSGVVEELCAQEGEVVPVGKVICVIATEEGADRGPGPGQGDGGDRAESAGKAREAVAKAGYDPEKGHRYSPAVRRLAREHGIDPESVRGTGAGGRVTKRDMLRAIEEKTRSGRSEAAPPEAEEFAYGRDARDEILPLTSMRRAIAQRMVRSVQTAPHAWTMVEVDVTNLVEWRESIKAEFRRREGVNLTYLPFVIKAAVEALKEYPIMNSMWEDDQIVIRKQINIGVAVDLEDGLIVPVIHNADQLSIAGIAKAVADLATRARAGKLRPQDVQGGTFTINNTGAFGSILSAPIINYPQAAILSMETITRRPVVIGDGIAIRWMVNLCVSLDHRILDGAVCGRFLRSVKQRLESYHKGMPLY
jgi:2-oxoisovalerate dehydrogenase E2 component (dihydrolipoyl transacylase)